MSYALLKCFPKVLAISGNGKRERDDYTQGKNNFV